MPDFILKKEKEYKELGLCEKELKTKEFARIAAEHSRLLERPIVTKGKKVVLARPASQNQ